MKRSHRHSSKIHDVLARIKVGLVGYVSYLDACDMRAAFSEYVLYEPTLRILNARGFSVQCEYPCPGFEKTGPGDYKKLDFFAEGHELELAIEMKWIKKSNPNIARDLEKLDALSHTPAIALLCLFGEQEHIEGTTFKGSGLSKLGSTRIAELKNTKYGCRFFELPKPKVAGDA